MMPWKSVYQYHRENQKIPWKFQHLFKAKLIPLANIMAPGLAQYQFDKALVNQLSS